MTNTNDNTTSDADDAQGTPKAGDNSKKAYNAFIARVSKFGKAAGQGEASLPALAMDAVRQAADRIIGIAKPTAGEDDDTSKVYHTFQTAKEAARGKVYTKEASFVQQVSKLRQVITVGATMYEEGVAVLQRAVDLHTEAAQKDSTRADMKSGTLYAFLVDVAREQLKEERKGIPMDDDAIEAILFPGTPDKKTDIERVEKVLAALTKLRDGTKGEDGFKPMDSVYITASIENIQELLYDMEPGRREKDAAKVQLELQVAAFGLKTVLRKRAA